MEPIQQALTKHGEDLVFTGFTIKAFPGFNVSVLYKQEVSVYEVEKQNFVFQTASLYCKNNFIVKDTEFYFIEVQSNIRFNFKLDRNPVDDLTGWSILYCNLISKVNL